MHIILVDWDLASLLLEQVRGRAAATSSMAYTGFSSQVRAENAIYAIRAGARDAPRMQALDWIDEIRDSHLTVSYYNLLRSLSYGLGMENN
jgi:hypothetical protein